MNPEIILKTKTLLGSLSAIYPSDQVNFSEEIVDTFNDLASLSQDVNELNVYLSKLSDSIDRKDRQGCVESVAVARSLFMNIESAYSNLADLMSDLAVHVRDLPEE